MNREAELKLTKVSIARGSNDLLKTNNCDSECQTWQQVAQLKNANERLYRENEELRQALEQERELSQKATQLLSMVVHELIAPLNIISFATSLLKRHGDRWANKKKQQYLDRIQTAIERLSQLMDGVLIIGRAENKKLTIETNPLDVEQFCREIISQLAMEDKGDRTINFVSQVNNLVVYLDRKLLQPVLINLLSNAIKYSPVESPANFSVSCQNETLIFQIQDKGIGIPASDLQKLFEPFYRGQNVGTIKGSGLGLTIVKKLIDLHGGRIEVESEVGVGTTFTIALPTTQKPTKQRSSS
jgi:signal transduction histidine kinase